MKTICSIFCSALILALLAGCAGIHYEGRADAPLPADAKVELFFAKDQLPKTEFTVLGKAWFDTSTSTPRREIQAKLIRFARENGANGVLIVSMNKIKTGEAREDQIYNRQAPGWNVEDNSNTALTYTQDTILFSSGKDPDKTLYDVRVVAELLRIGQPASQEK